MQLSEKIKSFISLCSEIRNSIDFASEAAKKKDDEILDLRHELELEKPTYPQRAKIATKMQRALQERRSYKDEVELHTPLATLIESAEGRTFFNQLNKVLGDTRRIEERHKNRTYRKRCVN